MPAGARAGGVVGAPMRRRPYRPTMHAPRPGAESKRRRRPPPARPPTSYGSITSLGCRFHSDTLMTSAAIRFPAITCGHASACSTGSARIMHT